MGIEVLIVDDEQPIVSVLARSLAARGYTVRSAATGEDALLALTEGRPRAMLLDVNLPDITGWEVVRQMTPQDRSRVPVVVFSAAPLSPARLKEFEPAGALVKPFPVEALLRLLEHVTRPAGVRQSVG